MTADSVAIFPPAATPTSGPTASIYRRGWNRRPNASSLSSGPRPKVKRSFLASMWALGKARRAGASCLSISRRAALRSLPNLRSATALWASGKRWMRFIQLHGISAHMGRFGSRSSVAHEPFSVQAVLRYPRSEPDSINPVVSAPDQTHIRSPFMTAAPISRLQRVGLRKTGPFCWSAF
jgi:hypothetical protein